MMCDFRVGFGTFWFRLDLRFECPYTTHFMGTIFWLRSQTNIICRKSNWIDPFDNIAL
jgi:hypothetical protein